VANAWAWWFTANATLAYQNEGSKRGDTQVGLRDWEMFTLLKGSGATIWTFSAMTTSAPFTLGGNGAPQLLQSGGTYRHAFVHDRTHPMPALMRLDGQWHYSFSPSRSVSVSAGPVGAPALGPDPWQHRPSTAGDFAAPLGHHWQDATHQSFGVVTAGGGLGRLQVETSLFNARESDEDHPVVDFRDARLDSWSARVRWAVGDGIDAAAWTGWLAKPHRLDPATNMHRRGASLAVRRASPWHGEWSSLLVVAQNVHYHGVGSHHLLHKEPGDPPYMKARNVMAESSLDIGSRNTIFGRVEYVEKNGEELGFLGGNLMVAYPVKSLVLGASREVAQRWSHSVDVGARGTLNFIPESLKLTYGTTAPKGVALHLRLRPTRSPSSH
jgi:hypothetical protein